MLANQRPQLPAEPHRKSILVEMLQASQRIPISLASVSERPTVAVAVLSIGGVLLMSAATSRCFREACRDSRGTEALVSMAA